MRDRPWASELHFRLLSALGFGARLAVVHACVWRVLRSERALTLRCVGCGKKGGAGPEAAAGGGTGVGSLGICAIDYGGCWEPLEEEELEFTLDSGSAIPAIAEHVGREFGYSGPASGRKYMAADGSTNLEDEGERTLEVITENGDEATMKARVTGVHKCLAAASAIVDRGNTIVLSRNYSYIINDQSEQIIPVYPKDGVYVRSRRTRRKSVVTTVGIPHMIR